MAGVDVVFHAASIIDITPVPSPRMHHVNVDPAPATLFFATCVPFWLPSPETHLEPEMIFEVVIR